MKTVKFGNTAKQVPVVIVGCMRFSQMSEQEMNHFMHSAMELGANYFDHADIYGNGMSEEAFGKALAMDESIRREDLIIQSLLEMMHMES